MKVESRRGQTDKPALRDEGEGEGGGTFRPRRGRGRRDRPYPPTPPLPTPTTPTPQSTFGPIKPQRRMMNSYNQPCFRGEALREDSGREGKREGEHPGGGVRGEVARLNNGVTLNPSPLMSVAATAEKK